VRSAGFAALDLHAHYVVELLDRFTREEEESAELYDLLADTLARLCNAASRRWRRAITSCGC